MTSQVWWRPFYNTSRSKKKGMSRRKDKAARLKKEQERNAELPNPFAAGALDALGDLPAGPEEEDGTEQSPQAERKERKRGRVDIIRETAHRGGKAVTIVKNFPGVELSEKKELAKLMQKTCGVGGTVKDGCIEIQGDQREAVREILCEAGFQPVFAGG